MKSRFLAAFLLASLPLFLAPRAHAEDDPATVQARARFKEGVEAFDKGKYEDARLAFLQAYMLKKHPAVLLNLAQSAARSNHWLEASKSFQQFLRESPNANADQRRSAESGLAEVRTKLGRIEVTAPPGTDVTIDEQHVGATPFEPVDVEIGTHTVRSSLGTVTVTAVAGQRVEAKLAGKAPEPEAAPPPKPATADEPPPRHRTSLLAPPANMTPVWVGVGVAGAGTLAAIVFGIYRNKAQDNADTVAKQIATAYKSQTGSSSASGACNSALTTIQSACKTLKSNNDKVGQDAAAANVSLGLAIAGAAFAGAWYLFAPKKDDEPAKAQGLVRPRLSPWATPEGGGLVLQGAL